MILKSAEQTALERRDFARAGGLQLHLDAAAQDRVGKLLRERAEEEEQGVVRRFLERFEKGVRGLELQTVGVDEHADLPRTKHGAEVEFALKVADLLDHDAARSGLRLNEVDIAVCERVCARAVQERAEVARDVSSLLQLIYVYMQH